MIEAYFNLTFTRIVYAREERRTLTRFTRNSSMSRKYFGSPSLQYFNLSQQCKGNKKEREMLERMFIDILNPFHIFP